MTIMENDDRWWAEYMDFTPSRLSKYGTRSRRSVVIGSHRFIGVLRSRMDVVIEHHIPSNYISGHLAVSISTTFLSRGQSLSC